MVRLSVPLVLASGSPRRRRLLGSLGLAFEVHVSGHPEDFPTDVAPGDAVARLALEKAQLVAPSHPDALTLAADTTVVLDGCILEKPADADEAKAMLRSLSGATHTVHTGIALYHPASNRAVTSTESTRVTFGLLTEAEIGAYVATGSPLDKAGAYGIQDDYGPLFVERIEGDFYTVVGLPLRRLYGVLREHFSDLLV
ncbi:MAG: nucleoside triphosphate pyrophosphatase [Bacteroidota bacterium]